MWANGRRYLRPSGYRSPPIESPSPPALFSWGRRCRQADEGASSRSPAIVEPSPAEVLLHRDEGLITNEKACACDAPQSDSFGGSHVVLAAQPAICRLQIQTASSHRPLHRRLLLRGTEVSNRTRRNSPLFARNRRVRRPANALPAPARDARASHPKRNPHPGFGDRGRNDSGGDRSKCLPCRRLRSGKIRPLIRLPAPSPPLKGAGEKDSRLERIVIRSISSSKKQNGRALRLARFPTALIET